MSRDVPIYACVKEVPIAGILKLLNCKCELKITRKLKRLKKDTVLFMGI